VKALKARMSSRRRKEQTVIYDVANCKEDLRDKLSRYNTKQHL
jgi:hypothetical protein